MLPAKLVPQLVQPAPVPVLPVAASMPEPVSPDRAASRHATRCCRSWASTAFTVLSAISDLILLRLSRSLARSRDMRADEAAVGEASLLLSSLLLSVKAPLAACDCAALLPLSVSSAAAGCR